MSGFDLVLLLGLLALLVSLAYTLAEPRFEIPERPEFIDHDLGVDDWRDLLDDHEKAPALFDQPGA